MSTHINVKQNLLLNFTLKVSPNADYGQMYGANREMQLTLISVVIF
jgi:hypothetical protein